MHSVTTGKPYTNHNHQQMYSWSHDLCCSRRHICAVVEGSSCRWTLCRCLHRRTVMWSALLSTGVVLWLIQHLGRVKRIWYLSPMRAAKVQASLRIRAVSPEPPLLAHTSSESRGTFRQKTRSLALLNGWACAVKICHDGMLEDTNSLDAAHLVSVLLFCLASWAGYEICLYRFRITVVSSEPRHDKTCLRECPTRQDTNRPAQLQKLARVLKFRL